MKKRIMSVLLCLCMMIALLPVTARAVTPGSSQTNQWVTGATIKATKLGSTAFNIWGVNGNSDYQTTFLDKGYTVAVSVDGGNQRNNPDNVIAAGLRLDVDLETEGDNFIKVLYTLQNSGSASHSVSVGTYADVMIDKNDYAPICAAEANGKTLSMTGAPKNSYAFKLVATACDKLWYGHYGARIKNVFTGMENRGPDNIYNGDSGAAWSWTGIRIAPGEIWQSYVLIGTGDADALANVSVPDIPAPAPPAPPVPPDPAITLNQTDYTIIEGDALPTDWNSFVASSVGTVTFSGQPADSNTCGEYTVTCTAASNDKTATAQLKVHILPLPASLSQTAASQSGSNFNLSATMERTGGLTFTETGFVYGALQNPTLTLNDGKVTTYPAVNTRNGILTATVVVSSLTAGITYYARAYAIAEDGTVIYGPQSSGFGLGVPSYGIFSVAYTSTSGTISTFTITRDGSDGAQTVYYRTVNGSAIGGTHFTHVAGKVDFAAGETRKTVTVTENSVTAAYGDNAATAYSNADRTYSLEIYRVEGGATIGTSTATRTMTKDSGYTIDSSFYNELTQNGDVAQQEHILDRTSDQGADNASVNFTDVNRNQVTNWNRQIGVAGLYSDSVASYLNATNGYWLYRFAITGHGTSNQGYQDVWFGYQKPPAGDLTLSGSTTPGNFAGQIWFDIFDFTTSGCRAQVLGNTSLIQSISTEQDAYLTVSPNNSAQTSDLVVSYNGNNYGKLTAAQDAWACFSAHGSGEDDWYIIRYQEEAILRDDREPQLLGIAPMDGSTYLPGQSVTISLIFDEIVDRTNSSSLSSSSTITTSWGKFTYAGGADTNVLCFTGTVPETTNGTISLTTLDCAGQIRDMCDTAGTTSAFTGTPSTTVTVGSADKPTVSVGTITNSNGTLTATIRATDAGKLEYVWSTKSTAPAYGWQMLSNTSGAAVTTRQTSDTWYLHARATNSDGVVVTGSQSINLSSGSGGAVALPDLTLHVDNSVWAKERAITVTPSPESATVKVSGPGISEDQTVSGNTYTANQNGMYTFTLTSDGEKVVQQIAVSRLDQTAPAVTVHDLTNFTHAAPVTLTFSVADAESGIGSVSAQWNTATADLINNGDGTYTTTSPNDGENGNWTLTVTVTDNVGNRRGVSSETYTVNNKAPVLTATEQSESNKGVVYSYSVNANGNNGVTVQRPDGTTTDVLNGTFTITEPGDYTISVTDDAGHFVSKPITVSGSLDGVAPDVRCDTNPWTWTNGNVTVTVNLYEAGGLSTVTWSKDGGDSQSLTPTAVSGEAGSYTASFTATENGTYTVTAKDTVGNVGTATVEINFIDKTAPTLSVTGGTTGAASLTLAVSSSGAESITAQKPNGETTTVTGSSYHITDAGTYTFTATSNAGLTAKQEVTVYSVTFDSAGGSTVATQLVVHGGKATQPTDPTKAGYTFGRWQKGDTAFNFVGTAITAAATLTAQWTAIPATAPTITQQPEDLSLTYGYTSGNVLTVIASAADDHDLSYQWYSNAVDSTSAPIDKATESSYTVPTGMGAGSYYYYCVVTAKRTDNGQTASVTSDVAAVTVSKAD